MVGWSFLFFVAPSLAVFSSASAFNQDVSKWDMSQVGNTGNMMTSTDNFDQGVWCTPSWNKFTGTLSMTGQNRVFCCNPGRFLNKSDPLAKKVDGTWTLTDGNSCPKCLEGQYTDSLNLNTSCIPADRDTFVPAKGLTVATDCPENSFTNPPNTSLCEICPAGKKMIRGTTATNCSKCDAGKFQNIPGFETCKDCPGGFYQNAKGIPYCIGCVPGQYQDEKGKESCEKCATGRHDPSGLVGGSSSSICLTCDKGQYQPENGSTFCLPCLTGTFQNASGSSSCNNCPIGFNNGDTKEEFCSECKAGKFQDAIQEANCKGMLTLICLYVLQNDGFGGGYKLS